MDGIGLRALGMLAGCDYIHTQGGGVVGDGASNAAEADQTESGAGDFTRALAGTPCDFLSPDVLLLKAHGLGNLFGESENQGDYMLGYDGAVNVTGVGQDHVARYEFWE